MLEKLSTICIQISTGPTTLLASILFISFVIFILPDQAKKMEAALGSSQSPDLSVWYSPSELYGMAEEYGEAGRAEYIRIRYTFDLLWPLVYSTFLLSALNWIFVRRLSIQRNPKFLTLLPLAAIFLDYLENTTTSIVMFRYPLKTQIIDQAAPLLTFLKWVSVSGSFLVLCLGLILLAWRILGTQKS